jgi:hypothetical protein
MPGFLITLRIFINREVLKKKRRLSESCFFLVLIMIAAGLIGKLNGTAYNPFSFHSNMMLVVLFLGTLMIISTLPTFTEQRLIFYRESSTGISLLAFFLARNIVDLPEVVIKPVVYTWIYYSLALVRGSWSRCLTGSEWSAERCILLPPLRAVCLPSLPDACFLLLVFYFAYDSPSIHMSFIRFLFTAAHGRE